MKDFKKLENSNVFHPIFDYNGAKFFTDGSDKKYYALKEKNSSKWGLVNTEGKLLTPFVYDDLGGFVVGEGNYIYMGVVGNMGYRMGLLDCVGNVVVEPISECTVIFSDGLAKISQKGKFGYVDMSGKLVIPVIFDDATDFKYGKAMVEFGNKRFCINKNGENF